MYLPDGQKVRCTVVEVLTEMDKAPIITLYETQVFVVSGHEY